MKFFLQKKRKQSGQSLVEFIVVSLSFFTFLFILLKVSLMVAVGHFVHYATFMAARSYGAAHRTKQEQIQMGKQVLASYLGADGNRFRSFIRAEDGAGQVGPGPQYKEAQADTHWQQGAWFTFSSNIFLKPLVRGVRPQNLGFVSESWTNREPTYEECETYMTQGRDTPWLFDNGC